MAGYVKLFGSILQSTVWETPATTRCVWITMLAMSDMDGIVSASVPGLARMAGVTRAECEAALAAFLAPDPDSRTKEFEGRRIEEVDGGWRLLNHAKYRAMQTREERREKDAERKRRARAGETSDDCGQERTEADSPQSHAPSRPVTGSESDQKQKQKQDQEGCGARAPARSNGDAVPVDPVPPAQRKWPAEEWLQGFRLAWLTYRGQSYVVSGGDRKAIETMRSSLRELPVAEALAAQTRSQTMFAEFFGDDGPELVDAGHPWSWFVERFGRLRLPRGPSRPRTRTAELPARAFPVGYAPLNEPKNYAAGAERFEKETA